MIGILGAMDAEVEAIFAQMTSKEKINVNNLTFYKGQLFGKDVVVVKCGIGKINAALCTQLLILTFKVEKVINTGIAVSTDAVYHDFDCAFFGYKLGQVPGLPETFKADEKMIGTAMDAFQKSALAKEHKITKGLIASGDQFIAGGERKNFIVNTFHPACVEMEGCSIAHTCFVNNVPFVIIRCMSDCADENIEANYDEAKAAAISSAFLLDVVKEI